VKLVYVELDGKQDL